jgi:hypothetical protein
VHKKGTKSENYSFPLFYFSQYALLSIALSFSLNAQPLLSIALAFLFIAFVKYCIEDVKNKYPILTSNDILQYLSAIKKTVCG